MLVVYVREEKRTLSGSSLPSLDSIGIVYVQVYDCSFSVLSFVQETRYKVGISEGMAWEQMDGLSIDYPGLVLSLIIEAAMIADSPGRLHAND